MNKSLFLNTEKFQFSTAPKLTCNHKFYPRNLTVSLQKALSFSKLCNLASAVQLPFRTDSNPHRRYPESSQYPVRPVIWWTPVISVKISNRTEIWIVPGSPEGRNPRRVFAVLFARRKKSQPVLPRREFRGSANLESTHTNSKFAQSN